MSRWAYRRLGDVCSTTSGGTPSRSNPEYFGGGIPWVKSGDLTDGDVIDCEESITEDAIRKSSAKLFRQGTVLIAMYGATVGKLGMLGMDAATNQAVCGISTPDELDRWFLFYFLLSQRQKLIEQSAGGAQPNISQKIVRELLIPIPPIPEQRRIVDLLSRAEGIVRLRREAEKKTAELIPALFLDMFGDPTTNPKGWKVADFGSVISYSRYGPRFPNREYAESGAHILRTTDMSDDGFLRWWESPIMSLTPEEVAKYRLAPRTLLITRTGTIGRVAMFNGASEPCVAGAYLLEFGLNDLISPDYVLAFFLSDYGQRHLLKGSRSVAQPNINAPTVMAITVPLPPIEDQNAFSKAVEGVRSIQSQQSAAAAKAQATFDALLASAFA